jgi:hypothetical protein
MEHWPRCEPSAGDAGLAVAIEGIDNAELRPLLEASPWFEEPEEMHSDAWAATFKQHLKLAGDRFAYCRQYLESEPSTPTSLGDLSRCNSDFFEVPTQPPTPCSLPLMPLDVRLERDDEDGQFAVPPPAYDLLRSTTAVSDPQSPHSDADVGYAAKLPRQADLPDGTRLLRETGSLRDGTAGMRHGTYLFVVMVGDPGHFRLVHEESLMATDWEAGHSSLVSPREFSSGWARGGCGVCRHTVLFAGELEYREGHGVLHWNNASGHYKPASSDHCRIALDQETFMPVELK